ncbi:flagellar motor stator protein MotA [Pacificimonas flava]|uniref:Flagellar motor stator protein MotA n=2 Tax=Pacificimonas TaxID=1960290 RepID=A0A219B717_9SPHN|nr:MULTISPECIES: flagellar motor stator protein MotA [Pacificimonas]MBZ6379201.1 flagellar motor stator protein MotA [Pacificimonas aurantium]OWV33578.1 flagellar motor stator protein MotA [Pacificimonas flava]
MFNGIGFLIILGCVFGSFILAGGKMDIVLYALPYEMMAIAGAALGAFLVSNSMGTVKAAAKGLGRSFKGGRWKESDYRDLLTLLFGLLSTFKKGGATAIEPHLDNPHDSSLFGAYPKLLKDHHLVEFICDYLRMMTVSFEDPHQLEAAMEADIERHHHEELAPQHALQTMADGLPAIGIVAAVLGVIKTMGSIDQPVEILGGMIGGALVGTFLGVLLSYCVVGPLASKLHATVDDDAKMFDLVKVAIVAHAHGLPTQVAVELARRMTPSTYAPSFQELETALDEAKADLNAAPA